MKKNKKIYIPYYIQYPNAIWKDVYLDGQKSDYKVSNEGNVLSFKKKKPKVLNGHKTKMGYVIYCLIHNNKEYWCFGQRLVALAFISKPDHLKEYSFDELEVNHIKGDYDNKSNNHVSNLEWVTSSENKYHAYETGLHKCAEDHPDAIYSNDQINEVCYLLEQNKLPRMKIAEKTGVDDATIGMVLAKKQWKSISKYYDFSNRKKKHTLYGKATIDKAIRLLKEKDSRNLSFADIGRMVGMSRTSIWYLYNKHFRN